MFFSLVYYCFYFYLFNSYLYFGRISLHICDLVGEYFSISCVSFLYILQSLLPRRVSLCAHLCAYMYVCLCCDYPINSPIHQNMAPFLLHYSIYVCSPMVLIWCSYHGSYCYCYRCHD